VLALGFVQAGKAKEKSMAYEERRHNLCIDVIIIIIIIM
jgi:hypothetical protein